MRLLMKKTIIFSMMNLMLTISDAIVAYSSGISSQFLLGSMIEQVLLFSNLLESSFASKLHNFSPTATKKSIFSLWNFQALNTGMILLMTPYKPIE